MVAGPNSATLCFQRSNDWDFTIHLPRKLDYNAKLYSWDLENLYPSIPINLGLETILYRSQNKSNLISDCFSKEFVLEALEFILRKNNFKFFNKYYNQIKDTVVGTKYAPPCKCLVLRCKEEIKLFPKELPLFLPLLRAIYSYEEIESIKNIFKR